MAVKDKIILDVKRNPGNYIISINSKLPRKNIAKETTYKLEMIIKHGGNLQVMPESGECSLAISQEGENFWETPKKDKKKFAIAPGKKGMVRCSLDLDNHKLCIGDVRNISGWRMSVAATLLDLKTQHKHKKISPTHYVKRHKVRCYDF